MAARYPDDMEDRKGNEQSQQTSRLDASQVAKYLHLSLPRKLSVPEKKHIRNILRWARMGMYVFTLVQFVLDNMKTSSAIAKQLCQQYVMKQFVCPVCNTFWPEFLSTRTEDYSPPECGHSRTLSEGEIQQMLLECCKACRKHYQSIMDALKIFNSIDSCLMPKVALKGLLKQRGEPLSSPGLDLFNLPNFPPPYLTLEEILPNGKFLPGKGLTVIKCTDVMAFLQYFKPEDYFVLDHLLQSTCSKSNK